MEREIVFFFRRGRPPDAVARDGVFFADSKPWGFLFDIFSIPWNNSRKESETESERAIE